MDWVANSHLGKGFPNENGTYKPPKEYRNTIDKSHYPNTKVIGSGIAQSKDGTWIVADCSALVCGYYTKEEAQARYRLVKHANKLLATH